jgi:arylsulfatase A-like enzyme
LAVGKWHLGYLQQYRPANRGLGEYYGTLGNSQYVRPKDFVDSRVGPDPARVKRDTLYTTDAYGIREVDWLERNKDKPFFLYFPFSAQHVPLQPPQRYLDRFPGIADENRKKFAATMSAMDDAIGTVLAKIREIGQEENTPIFFFSDNSGPTEQTTSNNGPLRGRKGTTLEGGVRIPFCVQWKGKLPAGKSYERPVIRFAILPTVIAAAGGTVDPAWKLDGVNLLPYLTGQKSAMPHQTLYWRFGEQWAIRDGDWKLVASRLNANQAKLFDLPKDIGEPNDLPLQEPAKVKKLTGAWKAWNAEQSLA